MKALGSDWDWEKVPVKEQTAGGGLVIVTQSGLGWHPGLRGPLEHPTMAARGLQLASNIEVIRAPLVLGMGAGTERKGHTVHSVEFGETDGKIDHGNIHTCLWAPQGNDCSSFVLASPNASGALNSRTTFIKKVNSRSCSKHLSGPPTEAEIIVNLKPPVPFIRLSHFVLMTCTGWVVTAARAIHNFTS